MAHQLVGLQARVRLYELSYEMRHVLKKYISGQSSSSFVSNLTSRKLYDNQM